MRRYIDAEKFKHIINNSKMYGTMEWHDVLEMLIETPTADVVEVVRCKDCENWDKHWISSTFTENAHYCTVLDNVFDGEFYCACGHRRRSF